MSRLNEKREGATVGALRMPFGLGRLDWDRRGTDIARAGATGHSLTSGAGGWAEPAAGSEPLMSESSSRLDGDELDAIGGWPGPSAGVMVGSTGDDSAGFDKLSGGGGAGCVEAGVVAESLSAAAVAWVVLVELIESAAGTTAKGADSGCAGWAEASGWSMAERTGVRSC